MILEELLSDIQAQRDTLARITQELVSVPSETPPSDTRGVAGVVSRLIADIHGVSVSFHDSEEPIRNLVAVLKSGKPGKRLILNGHMDTYPAGDHADWNQSPFSGLIKNGRVYGRGSGDMKGGLAAAIMTMKMLAERTEDWSGELVLTFAGDEESMGTLGTQYLLDTVPEARGDAMLCGDVGSPLVPRIGEKGMIWIDVFANGKPAHGAHVHRGVNAIDRLLGAMTALSELRQYVVETPAEAAQTIQAAKEVSEPLGGEGEAEVMQRVTVNFGRITGGTSANLVADRAELNADIRLPLGTTVAQVEAEIDRLLRPMVGITYDIVRRYEPTWTSPEESIVHAVAEACAKVLGRLPAVNMRVGASDARLYRAAGIPTVVCGLTPYNLGGPDEYTEIDEIVVVTQIHTLAALNFLSR
jgi:succinyl-diaminopimelate desuccinylase